MNEWPIVTIAFDLMRVICFFQQQSMGSRSTPTNIILQILYFSSLLLIQRFLAQMNIHIDNLMKIRGQKKMLTRIRKPTLPFCYHITNTNMDAT